MHEAQTWPGKKTVPMSRIRLGLLIACFSASLFGCENHPKDFIFQFSIPNGAGAWEARSGGVRCEPDTFNGGHPRAPMFVDGYTCHSALPMFAIRYLDQRTCERLRLPPVPQGRHDINGTLLTSVQPITLFSCRDGWWITGN